MIIHFLVSSVSNESSSQIVPPLPQSKSTTQEDHNQQPELNNQISNETSSSWQIEEQKTMTNSTMNNSPERMVVPKLTLKIPKAFQNQRFDNIESDEDSGDDSDDENEDDENEDEEQGEEESASDEDNEHYANKSESFGGGKNMSNSKNNSNAYSSSLSDTDNEESRNKKNNDDNNETLNTQQKRPENMPILKLKIKNLTSNPESVLESFDYASRKLSGGDSEKTTIRDQSQTLNDVDMTECPMDIEPSLELDTSQNSTQPDDDDEDEPEEGEEEPEKEPEPKKIIVDGNVVTPASEDIIPIEIRLDEGLDKIDIIKLMKICLRASIQYCLYCNHARKIVVNGKGLAIHFITHHRFNAFVDSITAEELHPEKFISKFEQSMDELQSCYFNLETYDDHDQEMREGHVTVSHDKLYECFQCRFQTPIHKELYLHNRKMHQKSLINCLMCKTGFYSYSELLCHVCPGVANKLVFNDYTFYCCLCNMTNIPSAFRLMVHLRKKHFACDVCLEKCSDQAKLSSHVWKHKLLHICYKCHIFYQNKADIMKHLFWKHGTEGIECKKCLQKKWPHVYHFCVPPAAFTCQHCEMQFSRAMALKVHLRLHEDGSKYACTELGCEKKFISKKLLIRHLERHQSELAALEKGDQERTEGTVLIPQEIPEGCCTRTMPVVFKRFIKKPPIRKHAPESKTETAKKETEPQPKKEEEKEPKALPDLPETKLNLSESSDNDSSSGDEKSASKKSASTQPQPQQVLKSTLDAANKAKKLQTSAALKKLAEIKDDDPAKSLAQLNKVSTLSDSDDDDDDDNNKDDNNDKDVTMKEEEIKNENAEPMKNILENLKNYQESQQQQPSIVSERKEQETIIKAEDEKMQTEENEPTVVLESKYKLIEKKEEPEEVEDRLPDDVILHVCFSDHDYAQLYRPPAGTTKDDLEDMIQSATIDKDKNKEKNKKLSKAEKAEAKAKAALNKKKSGEKTTKNDDFSSSDSSSSGSSSDSSSGSSSGSSSSSSSGSSSDSSSSEASSTLKTADKPRNKKYTKKRSKKEKKADAEAENVEPPRDPDDIIYESDLQTDETDTDEDFYDEHPLNTNDEALTEKRKQLGNIDEIIENSRPSTPSLPPDEKVEKRMKVKKRKREHKKIASPMKRLHRESSSIVNADEESMSHYNNSMMTNQPETPQNMKHSVGNNFGFQTSTPISAPPRIELHQANQIRQLLQSTQQQPVLPILKEQHHYLNQSLSATMSNADYISVSRISSAQSSRMNSDTESGIKRSQRRRIPNKFYGYTSDDDSMATQVQNLNDPFKPIPPPNLTWHKDDLPSRSPDSQQLQQPLYPPLTSSSQQQQQQQHPQQRVAPIKLNLHQDQLQQQLQTFATEHQQQQPAPPQIYENYNNSMQNTKLPINNLSSNENVAHNHYHNPHNHHYQQQQPQKQPQHHQQQQQSDSGSSDEDGASSQLLISETRKRKRRMPSQNMYAFHTLETPPTVAANQPPIPRLKLTIGSNNKIRRRNINPLKPPAKKRKTAASTATQSKSKLNDLSAKASNAFAKQFGGAQVAANLINLPLYESKSSDGGKASNKQPSAQEKQQKLEEAILNTQQYFQRYNHTQVASSETAQEAGGDGDLGVYCYCRRPYDEAQGMIGCDGPSCQIEWFHFECVGILVPPKGSWYCPECQKTQLQPSF